MIIYNRHTSRRPAPTRRGDRRGVTGVLAMMFLIMFGSLAAAMAVVSKGNLQTAHTQLRVNQALGAVDTGLAIARARLDTISTLMRVEKGEVDPDYAMQLWLGTFNAVEGRVVDINGVDINFGLSEFLEALHDEDNTVSIDAGFTAQEGWLATEPVVLQAAGEQPTVAAGVTYIPVPEKGAIRAIATGYSWDFTTNRWITRTAQQDFRIFKRIDHAVLGPSKIMIGKNVQINGPLGARFTGVENQGGHPIHIRSDFYGLEDSLDAKLDDFYEAVLEDDTNGDNRLSMSHSIESRSLSALNAKDYSGDGSADNAFEDNTDDGLVDEFDIFLHHFDQNSDGRIVLSEALTAGTPADGESPEFDGIDDELAMLIDSARPDRNGDGVVDARDTVLGYRDGVIDYRDRYAKVRGSIYVRANRAAWEAQEDGFGQPLEHYQEAVKGVIRAEEGDLPVAFDIGDDVLPEIETDTFNTSVTALRSAADGAAFATQAGLSGPAFSLVTDSDGVVLGQDFHSSLTTVIEATPYGGAAPVDFYERPVFEDLVFKNVVIPRGLNALFRNCTFVGVTRVENVSDNSHVSWQFYGQQLSDGSLKYPPPPAESDAQLDNDYFTDDIIRPDDFDYPRLELEGTEYVNTKPLSNNIRFHDCTFVGSIVADKPNNYTHVRNKLQFTGATRFFEEHPENPDDPDLNPDDEDLEEIRKSSMLLPHYSVDIGTNNAPPEQDVNLQGVIIAGVLDVRGKTTIDGALLMTFEPSTDDPALQHFGTPAGNPADFNITLGYFGPDEGDEEGFNLSDLEDLNGDGNLDLGYDENGDGFPDENADPATSTVVPFNGFGRIIVNWNPELVMPDGLIAPLTIEPIDSTYREGRLIVGDYQ